MKEITFQAKRYTISAYVRDFFRVTSLQKFFVAFSILLLTGFSSWSQSITVDGNPGDWEILEASDPSVYNHISDPFGTGVVDNQFTEGAKDYNIAADLIWADGQTKPKNDIANAAAYLEGTTLYFAGDKTSNNGDAQLGFWFYLNNTAPRVLATSPKRSGDFFPEHAIGDLFVLIDFTGGGKFGNVSSYVWVGPGNGAYGNNNSLDLAGPGNVAQNNLAEFDVPDGWNFISATYDENQFFEGSINLANLEITDACFSRFLVEARSSHELTASLDDFAAGEFNVEPQASVNDITACENDGPFILTAIADGGLGTLEYEWRKLPSNEIIGTASTLNVTESGQYSVIILGQGVFGGKCPSQPAIATVLLYDNVDAGTDGTDRFCIGDAVNGIVNLVEIITGEEAGGSWADTDATGVDISDPTSVDLSGLGDGVYVFTYTVTPATGSTCPPDSSTATITIDDTVNAGTDGTDRFCIGDAVNGIVNLVEIITGEEAGGSWADTDATGVDISDPTSVDLSTLGDGVYVFTYTVTPATGSTCPPDSSTATITIDDTVNAGNDGTDRFCVGDAVNGIVNLVEIITGEEAGGSWADTDATGVDISDPTSVDLSGLGDGVYVFTYTVTPATGSTCPPDSSTATITIDDTVNAGTDGTDRFCIGDAVNGIVNLVEIITGEEAGGSWADTDATGVDISDPTSVDLSGLGDGVYVFTYTVTPATGSTCPPDSSTATITIDDTVNAGTDGTDRFCIGDAVNGIVNLVEIITGEEAGGSWADTDATGVDISDPTSVDLSTLGDGVYVFTYTVTPATGSTCPPDSSTATITIDDTVNAGNDGTDRFCVGDAVNGIVNLVEIITGEEAGGSWADTDATGVDISDPTSVDLSGLGDGVYVFTYTITPATGSTCTPDSSTATITIDPLPVVTILDPPSDPVCSSDDSGILAGFQFLATPTGGTWSGDVDSDGKFVPDINESTQTIRYDYIDVNGCANYDEISFEYQDQPQDDTDFFEICLSDIGTIDLSTYIPTGATNVEYSGNAVDAEGNFIGDAVDVYVANITYNFPGNICRLGISITITVIDCLVCETAFAKKADDATSYCFINESPVGFNQDVLNSERWGWTNYISLSDFTLENSYTQTLTLYAAAGQCDINKGTAVGEVIMVYNPGSNILVVTYDMFENLGYILTGAHLYVGNAPYPSKKKGKTYEYTVAPGQYPFNSNGDMAPTNTVEFTIEDVNQNFYIIAHADVCTSSTTEFMDQLWEEAQFEIVSLGRNNDSMIYTSDPSISTKTSTSTTSLSESSEPIFSIAPVPFKDVLNIGYLFDYTSDVTIQVFDLNGRLLTTYKDTAVNSDSISTFNVDFRTKSNQIYIVRMTTDREVYSAKIISAK